MQGILAVLPKIVYAIYPTYSIFVGIIYHLTFAFLILKGRDGQAMVEGLYDLNLTPNVLRLTDFVKKRLEMDKSYSYSFIIPHKNTPELLKRCVDSIPVRDDIQIIIVDDNSDDDKKPSIQRNNVEIIPLKQEQSNGAGRARNIGIERALGKWLLFADADDFYTDKIEIILKKYESEEMSDMVILNAQMIDEEGKTSPLRMSMYIDNYIKKRFYSEKVLRFEIWTPWSRMIRRSFVEKHKFRFEEVPTGNDMMFCLLCSKYAEVISVENIIVYNYLNPVGRSLTNAYSKEITSIEPKVERTFRRYDLYKDVHYIFKPEHIRSRFKVRKIDKSFYLLYNELLRKHSYSNIKDVWYFLLYVVGRLVRIV